MYTVINSFKTITIYLIVEITIKAKLKSINSGCKVLIRKAAKTRISCYSS